MDTNDNNNSSDWDILKLIHSLLEDNGVLNSKLNEPVIKFQHPHELKELIDFKINTNGIDDRKEILEICKKVINYSVKTGHQQFHNQLFGGVDPIGLAGSWITEALNTSQYTFEVAPVFTLIENELIKTFTNLFGYSSGDGILTPGGSMSNMYAMILARYKAVPNVKITGLYNTQKLIAFTSEEAHYSITKSVQWLGIGMENLILIKTDKMGRMLVNELEAEIKIAISKECKPFFVNVTCGTTVLGSFDNLIGIAEICKKYNIWMHVDACLGGSIIFSKKYKHLLNGIEQSNSIAWNPHKTLGVPLQCSFFLINENDLLYKCNAVTAQYLFQQDKYYDVSYDTGHKSIQCGRKVDAFKFWLMLKVRGFSGFEKLIDNALDLSKYLTIKLRNRSGFRLIIDNNEKDELKEFQYTNVCFWYIPKAMRNLDETKDWWTNLSLVCPMIKEKLIKSGTLMIGYSPLKSQGFGNFFRMVLTCFPPAQKSDIDFIINEIESVGENI